MFSLLPRERGRQGGFQVMLHFFSIENRASSLSRLSPSPSFPAFWGARSLSALATHAPPPRRRPAAAAAAAAAAGAATSSFINVEPFQVSQQQETGAAAAASSASTSSGDLRARAQQQTSASASLSADDEFLRRSSLSRDRSRSRGRLPTTADTSSRHRSLSQQRRTNRRLRGSSNQGPAATVLEGFADAWETIMGGGIEMFRSEAMSLMQVRLVSFFSFSESGGR